jgi:hypothetical protein
VRLAHKLAIESQLVSADMIEATEFPELSRQYMVRAVPKIVINDEASFEGNLPEGMFVDHLFAAVEG